jgi:peptide/nickel transport system permease protein
VLGVVGRRLLLAVPTLLTVSVVIFVLLNVLPGDPLAGLLSPDATRADRDNLAHSLGLDLPLPVQYGNWLLHLARVI